MEEIIADPKENSKSRNCMDFMYLLGEASCFSNRNSRLNTLRNPMPSAI
jgi:hypothetical protein